MSKNQKGIALILPIILILLIIVVVVFIAYSNLHQGKSEGINKSNISQGSDNKHTQYASLLPGKYCNFIAKHGEEISYYEVDNKYFLSEAREIPDESNSKSIHNVLYTGSHYYYWYSGEYSKHPEPMVFTKDEAQDLSLVRSYQIGEVEKNQQYCKDTQVDTQKFIPPKNMEFKTVEQDIKEWQKVSEEGFAKLCNICLREYTNRQEQLDCFSISNIVGQQPNEVVENLFEEYCITD